MADRDKIPSNIPKQYKPVYQQICELQDPTVIAQSALKPIRERLQSFGNSPVEFIHKVAQYLQPMSGNSMLLKMVDWNEEHKRINELSNEFSENHNAIDIAKRGCHQILSKLEDGEMLQEPTAELLKSFISNIWRSEVEENVLMIDLAQGELNEQFAEEYFQDIQTSLSSETESFVDQLTRHKNVNALRLPNRNQSTDQLLDVDIMGGIV